MTQMIECELTGRTMTDDEYVSTGEYALVSVINGQMSQAKRILKENPDAVDEYINLLAEMRDKPTYAMQILGDVAKGE